VNKTAYLVGVIDPETWLMLGADIFSEEHPTLSTKLLTVVIDSRTAPVDFSDRPARPARAPTPYGVAYRALIDRIAHAVDVDPVSKVRNLMLNGPMRARCSPEILAEMARWKTSPRGKVTWRPIQIAGGEAWNLQLFGFSGEIIGSVHEYAHHGTFFAELDGKRLAWGDFGDEEFITADAAKAAVEQELGVLR
jgi:hypothetical protein